MKKSFARDRDLPFSPIDVVEVKGDHLAGAKTESGEEKKDRVVASTGGCTLIACAQHTLELLRREVLRYAGQPPVGHRGYGSGQVNFDFSTLKKETEERSEGGNHELRPSGAHRMGVVQDKVRYVR